MFQKRERKTFEETPVQNFNTAQDFSQEAISAYRQRRGRLNPNASELTWSDEELLYALAAVTTDVEHKKTATVCGLVSFGNEHALRRCCPFTRVDYIRIPGRQWIEDPENRFDTIDIRGPILTLAPRVIATILDDLPKTFRISSDGMHREDIPLIPERVIREAVVNSLMHRNYRTRQPIQVIRYSNRIEIRNPGCSLKPDDRLGEPGSIARNEKIAEILHECNLAETKGSGIRAMREYMEKANLTLPLFESDRDADTFTLTLLTHHFMDEGDIQWLGHFTDCDLADDEARALIFLKEAGAINNAVYRDICKVDTSNASGHLRKLRNVGLLEQKGRASRTYYVPGQRFLDSLIDSEDKVFASRVGSLSGNLESLSGNLGQVGRGQEEKDMRNTLLQMLPEMLQKEVNKLGKRIAPAALDSLVEKVCDQMPMSRQELSCLLYKSDKHMQDCLRRMINARRLRLLYPEIPNHPNQKYMRIDENEIAP